MIDLHFVIASAFLEAQKGLEKGRTKNKYLFSGLYSFPDKDANVKKS